jgi:1-phosphatidylinositol-4-phosphate 5-kinase
VRRRVTNRDSHFHRQNSAGLKTLRFEVSIYTPEYYSWLFRKEDLNLFHSFDIRRNLSQVKEESYTEGGKSGEFFFATFDHRYIFKTIKA